MKFEECKVKHTHTLCNYVTVIKCLLNTAFVFESDVCVYVREREKSSCVMKGFQQRMFRGVCFAAEHTRTYGLVKETKFLVTLQSLHNLYKMVC